MSEEAKDVKEEEGASKTPATPAAPTAPTPEAALELLKTMGVDLNELVNTAASGAVKRSLGDITQTSAPAAEPTQAPAPAPAAPAPAPAPAPVVDIDAITKQIQDKVQLEQHRYSVLGNGDPVAGRTKWDALETFVQNPDNMSAEDFTAYQSMLQLGGKAAEMALTNLNGLFDASNTSVQEQALLKGEVNVNGAPVKTLTRAEYIKQVRALEKSNASESVKKALWNQRNASIQLGVN